MATRTINLYPSSDISCEHSASSGSNRYAMINDVTDDSGSTYIEHTLSDTDTTKTSSFNCTANSSDNPPTGKIRINNVQIMLYDSRRGQNVNTIDVSIYMNLAYGGSSTYTQIASIGQTGGALDANYHSHDNHLSPFRMNKIFNNLSSFNPKFQIVTTGKYTQSS